jgi:chromosome segregation ATPase
MPKHSIRKLLVSAVALFLVLGFLIVDSSAQKRKRRRRSSAPRITNPEIYQPAANENANSNSSADSTGSNANANTNGQQATEDPESMKRTIRTLSNQVDRLNDKLNSMEQSQQSLVDLERLSRAEQRSAQLRSELRDVQAKKADLEAHLEDVDYALKPENIERATQGYGTTRPEEVREQRRKQLEAEKQRGQAQLDQLRASEDRLQQAIATSDAEVDRLQKKMDAADRAAIENAKTKAQENQTLPTPTPTP